MHTVKNLVPETCTRNFCNLSECVSCFLARVFFWCKCLAPNRTRLYGHIKLACTWPKFVRFDWSAWSCASFWYKFLSHISNVHGHDGSEHSWTSTDGSSWSSAQAGWPSVGTHAGRTRLRILLPHVRPHELHSVHSRTEPPDVAIKHQPLVLCK